MSRNSRKKGMKFPGGFIGIPKILAEHQDFLNLSMSGKVALIALIYQYRGGNNGDLSAAPRLLKPWGIKSRTTAQRAVSELLDANLILRTREGQFLNPGGRCALYALTWLPIDDCGGKLEVASTNTPPRKLSLERSW
ncbi:MAG: hypothetical protein CL553_13455 [Alcanivorax sp.]|nr:hypothetical protein [Alcanivorax sp.]|tara:strand:+ start:3873 stop:4283 length:411 start_codon:yes stop_codon:yes gene_type:complete